MTFPARQYSVNGERRSFALLRPIDDIAGQARIRDRILEAYAELEARAAQRSVAREQHQDGASARRSVFDCIARLSLAFAAVRLRFWVSETATSITRLRADGPMMEWMSEQRLLNVNVECYAGHRGEQTPRTLVLGDRRIAVVEVLDAWLAPDHRYFKLRGADGDTYLVRHDERSDIWELTMFRAKRING